MAVRWKREIIEQLIICVQQHECIFNVKSLNYLDRTKKASAFNEILDTMKKYEPNLTLDELKRKWKILRTQFMQEMRMMNNSKKSGAGASDIYVPKLWCFEQLFFLKTHTQSRSSIDNTEESNEAELSDISNIISERQYEEPPKKRAKTSGEINNFRNELKNFKGILTERKKERKFCWLGNLVSFQMEEINKADQANAAWQIQCLMRKLTDDSARKRTSTSSSASTKDILELSMNGVFDEDDFD